MKAKYKKFNQYLTRLYYGLNITPLRTWKVVHLRHSQINVDFSYKMKNLRENRKWFKHLFDVRHRIKQKEQRILRESRKQFIGVIDENI